MITRIIRIIFDSLLLLFSNFLSLMPFFDRNVQVNRYSRDAR